MPERWETKLRELRRVEVPAGSWDRVLEGPDGEGLPRNRPRVVAGAVAIALFLGAAAFAWVALRPGPSVTIGGEARASVTIRLDPGTDGLAPSAVLSFEGEDQQGVPFTVSEEDDGGLKFHSVDLEAGIDQVAGFVRVPQDAEIRLVGDIADPWVFMVVGPIADPGLEDDLESVGYGVELTPDSAEDSTWTLSDRWRVWLADRGLDTGRVGVAIAGRWPDGAVFGYLFGIEVVAAESPSAEE